MELKVCLKSDLSHLHTCTPLWSLSLSGSKILHEGNLDSGKYPGLVTFIMWEGFRLAFHICCAVDNRYLNNCWPSAARCLNPLQL